MSEHLVPKWQQELRAFLGIKRGIILEGNVYDDFLCFAYEEGSPVLETTDNLEYAIYRMVDSTAVDLFFFDPVAGFYCTAETLEEQRERLKPLFDGYTTTETLISHGCYAAVMPTNKKHGGGSRFIWISEIIRNAITETAEHPVLFVLNFASRLEACNTTASESNTMFLNLMAATTTAQQQQFFCNSFVMVVDKYNDIPAWLYLNNPHIHTISISVPDRRTRRAYLESLVGELTPFQILSNEDYDAGKRFVAETEGMRLQEIRQILSLAYRMGIKPDNIDQALQLYKYGVMDNPWEELENDIVADIGKTLDKRVKGQPEALKKVKTVVTRAVRGLSGLQHSSSSHKPKGILFFAGPTGVGKTETAKALAEAIFGDEKACIRFDMSEYREEHSDQKLFGAPPGYVGYEGGGQLTNAVKTRPFSVLLFDEIEKASPTILDKFLQILEDGRMTDNQGNTVYFGETLIIFTSNIGLTKDVINPKDPMGPRTRVPTITIEDPETEDTPEFREELTQMLTAGVEGYFTGIGRPELLNRLGRDNIVVFQFINKEDAKVICRYKLESITENIRAEKGIDIDTSAVVEELCRKAVLERSNGGRGVGNMLEREFLNPLAEFICTLSCTPRKLRCKLDANNALVFEVADNEN